MQALPAGTRPSPWPQTSRYSPWAASPVPASPSRDPRSAAQSLISPHLSEGENQTDTLPLTTPPLRQEFACFSYDENHEFHLGDRSMKWYYTPRLGADLSKGFDSFQKHDDSRDEHLDSLLKTIVAHEQETGQKIDANVVTWRGMVTKVCVVDQRRRNSRAARAASMSDNGGNPSCRY